jgi:hypothetical protein
VVNTARTRGADVEAIQESSALIAVMTSEQLSAARATLVAWAVEGARAGYLARKPDGTER